MQQLDQQIDVVIIARWKQDSSLRSPPPLLLRAAAAVGAERAKYAAEAEQAQARNGGRSEAVCA